MAAAVRGMKFWADGDRPREKLHLQGRRVLTDAELLALLIGTGTQAESALDLSRRLLHRFGNDLYVIGKCSLKELSQEKGIGKAKASRILAAFELGRRRSKTRIQKRPELRSSLQVYQFLKHTFQDLQHEESWAIYMDTTCRVIRRELIGSGGNNFTPVDVKLVFRYALECGAHMLVLAHNHPSGSLIASKADLYLTEKLLQAGRLLDIEVSDHLIFTDGGYLSFRDEGLISF